MKVFYTPSLFAAVLCLVMLLAGCRNKKTVVHHGGVSSCEARLIDVPFPLHSTPKDLEFTQIGQLDATSAQVAVEFNTALSGDELVHFYHREMEQSGWKELSVFSVQDELTLLYEKPFKFCLITVRLDQRLDQARKRIRCFVKPK